MLGGHGYFVDNMLLYHEKKDTGICICYVLDVMPTKQPAMHFSREHVHIHQRLETWNQHLQKRE